MSSVRERSLDFQSKCGVAQSMSLSLLPLFKKSSYKRYIMSLLTYNPHIELLSAQLSPTAAVSWKNPLVSLTSFALGLPSTVILWY
jgi:hypothetical protein